MFAHESDGLHIDEETYFSPAVFGENIAFCCGCGNVLETLRSRDAEFLWEKTPKIVVKQAIFLD